MCVGFHEILSMKIIMNQQEIILINLVLLKIELKELNFPKVTSSEKKVNVNQNSS